jgi:hypothetical protein
MATLGPTCPPVERRGFATALIPNYSRDSPSTRPYDASQIVRAPDRGPQARLKGDPIEQITPRRAMRPPESFLKE